MDRGLEVTRARDDSEFFLDHLDIGILGLNNRTRQLLERAGILTIGQAITKSDSQRRTIFAYELVCLNDLEGKLDNFLSGLLPAENCV